MKTCNRCNLVKPLEAFAIQKGKRDGRNGECRNCKSERDKIRYQKDPSIAQRNKESKIRTLPARQKARWDIIWNYLTEHPCVDCGETNPLVLQFDHVRGTKLKDVGELARDGSPMNLLVDEIKKCDVRCANHHQIVTAQRANNWRWRRSQG